jgi:hypothetical protein
MKNYKLGYDIKTFAGPEWRSSGEKGTCPRPETRTSAPSRKMYRDGYYPSVATPRDKSNGERLLAAVNGSRWGRAIHSGSAAIETWLCCGFLVENLWKNPQKTQEDLRKCRDFPGIEAFS